MRVRLSTRRFGLRPPEERDIARIAEGCRDPDVARYIPVIPVPQRAGRTENRASQRVAEQAGFVRAGVVVAHDPPFRDGSTDAIRYDRPSVP